MHRGRAPPAKAPIRGAGAHGGVRWPIIMSIRVAPVPMYTRRRLWVRAAPAVRTTRTRPQSAPPGWFMAGNDNSVTILATIDRDASTAQADGLPDTLIVSWHWPPTNRASTGVLANLFHGAPAERFRVVTRRLPRPPEEDCTPVPAFETHAVPWRLATGREGTPTTWWASILATARMILAARRWHEARPFDRVVAVYPHRFSLLAGWWIARRTGVPLVAYMHDLFAEAYVTGSWLKRTFWQWLDHRALADAALVVVPTDEFATYYRGRGIESILVLPHCTPAEVEASPPPKPKRTLELVYTGNLYDAHEDSARAFLAASDSLSDIRVTLLTPPHPMLGGRPARWASRDGALTAMREADVCVLLLGFSTPYPREVHGCFPSKMVDYLATGKPILAVVPPGCFVDRFVRETGAGITVNTLDTAEIRAAIDALRNADLRERLAEAAGRTARQLCAEIHLPRFLRGLATLEAAEDDECPAQMPAMPCRDNATEVPRVTVDARREGVCATI